MEEPAPLMFQLTAVSGCGGVGLRRGPAVCFKIPETVLIETRLSGVLQQRNCLAAAARSLEAGASGLVARNAALAAHGALRGNASGHDSSNARVSLIASVAVMAHYDSSRSNSSLLYAGTPLLAVCATVDGDGIGDVEQSETRSTVRMQLELRLPLSNFPACNDREREGGEDCQYAHASLAATQGGASMSRFSAARLMQVCLLFRYTARGRC